MGALGGWVLQPVGEWSRCNLGRAKRVVDRAGPEVCFQDKQQPGGVRSPHSWDAPGQGDGGTKPTGEE